jgi:hypothetical protein
MAKTKKQTKPAGKTRKSPKAAQAPAAAPKTARVPRERDPRLPAVGTTLTRTYKGKDYKVAVLDDGFRYDGDEFRSLSALASRITGAASINGFLWFGLTGAKAATEQSTTPAKTRTQKTKRAGRDPQLVATETAPATEPEVARAE